MNKAAVYQIFLIAAAGFLLAGPVLTEPKTETLYPKVIVNKPSALDMIIEWYPGRSFPKENKTIDFSEGATGVNKCVISKTSWDDTKGSNPAPEDDGYIAKTENIAFSAVCLSPGGGTHVFKISCGKLKKSDGTSEIPYVSPDGRTKYFGFSCTLDGGVTPIVGDGEMQLHSLTGWSYNFSATDYGHVFGIYNLLKIPVNTIPGTYSTTGSGDYQNMTLTFI